MINKAGIDFLNSQFPVVFNGNDPDLEIVFLSRHSVSFRKDSDKGYHISLTGVGRALQSVLIDQYIVMNCWQDERIHSEFSAALKPRFSGLMLDNFDSLKECYVLVNTAMDISFRNDSDFDPDMTCRLLAYVYYHNGYSAASSVVDAVMNKLDLKKTAREYIIVNYSKTLLQEITQRDAGLQPMYVVEQEGLSHKSTFKCMVVLGDRSASGLGSRKKEAEFDAAKNYVLKYHANDPSLKRFDVPFSRAIMANPSIPQFISAGPGLKKLDLDGRSVLSCLYTIDNYKMKYRSGKGFYQGNTSQIGDRLMLFMTALVTKELIDKQDDSIMAANKEFPSLTARESLYLSLGEIYGIKAEMVRVNRTGNITDSQVSQAVRSVLTCVLLEKIDKNEQVNDLLNLYDPQVKREIVNYIRRQYQDTESSDTEHFQNAANTLHDVMGICLWNVNVISVDAVPYNEAPKAQQGLGFQATVELTADGKHVCSGRAVAVTKKEATNLAKEEIWKNVYHRFDTWQPEDPIIRSTFTAACNMKRPYKSRKQVYDLLLKRLPKNPILMANSIEQAKNYIYLLYSSGRRDLDYEIDYLIEHFVRSMHDMPSIDMLMTYCPDLFTKERNDRINKIVMSHLR